MSIVLNARTSGPLEQSAAEIAVRYGVTVAPVAADVTTPEGRAKLLVAARAPISWSTTRAGRANMLSPILLITAVLPGMIERRWGRIVNIASGSVKAPIAELGLSGAARSGLTGFVAGTSRQVAKYSVTINDLLPGQHETARIDARMNNTVKARGISTDAARKQAHAANPTGRFGTTEEPPSISVPERSPP